MGTYSVAEAKSRLAALIDKAIEGEEVVITRHDKPVAELHARHQPSVKPSKAGRRMLELLLARTRARKSVGITSVELVDQMYEDDENVSRYFDTSTIVTTIVVERSTEWSNLGDNRQ